MMAPGTTLPGNDYIAFGQSISNGRSLWVEGQYTNGQILYFNAIRYNERFAISINPDAHGTQGPFVPLFVGNGYNYNTSPGDTRPVVAVYHYTLNPGFDVSLFEFGGDPLPGQNIVIGQPPSFLSKVRVTGFGTYAIQDGVLLAQDGNIRGFEMVMDRGGGGLDPANYASAFVSPSVVNMLTKPGGASSFDSGGTVEDETTGAVIGWVKSGSGGTGAAQTLNFGTFKDSGFDQWLAATAQIPEPGSLFLLRAFSIYSVAYWA